MRTMLLVAACVPLLSSMPAQAGIFVDGAVTTDHPTYLTINRNGTNNVLTWVAPSNQDGRTLLGYMVLRSKGDGLWAPTEEKWVGAPTTSFTDLTADYGSTYAYAVTARYEDADGVETESNPSVPAYAYDPLWGMPPSWPCQPVDVNLASTVPGVLIPDGCVV